MKRRQLTLADMQNLAKSYGGKCLSKEYITNRIPLQWMCKRGHTWDRTYDVIQQNGIWCRQCQKDESVLEDLRELAEERDFKCLSKSYVNSYTNLKWQCSEGHIFNMLAKHFKKWGCSICNKKKKREDALKKIIAHIEKKGGKYISGTYAGTHSKIKLRCKNGHLWQVSRNMINSGKWCPTCKRDEICQKALKKLDDAAKKLGGRCLSKTFTRTDRNLKWQCKEGHTWLGTPKNFKKGNWCVRCSREEQHIRTRKKLFADLSKYALSKGGKVLSQPQEHISYWQKLKLTCAKGHTWFANPYNTVNRNAWCHKCFTESTKLTIEELRQIAKDRGGILLSKKYERATAKLKWKCAKGHVWQTTAEIIRGGSWCKTCWYERNKC